MERRLTTSAWSATTSTAPLRRASRPSAANRIAQVDRHRATPTPASPRGPTTTASPPRTPPATPARRRRRPRGPHHRHDGADRLDHRAGRRGDGRWRRNGQPRRRRRRRRRGRAVPLDGARLGARTRARRTRRRGTPAPRRRAATRSPPWHATRRATRRRRRPSPSPSTTPCRRFLRGGRRYGFDETSGATVPTPRPQATRAC